jgi:hypothetical protein
MRPRWNGGMTTPPDCMMMYTWTLPLCRSFEEHGLDAADTLHALAFANAGYPLWHANQAARYNILNGIMPPESGHWKNNPHADDIDFQIEADFAGLMAPGMINASSAISDKIGHIMNYGDGWYGGVFVAGMYTQAFVSDDMGFIVREALKAIPVQSRFYQTIADVINGTKCIRTTGNRPGLNCRKNGLQKKDAPTGFSGLSILMPASMRHILSRTALR